MTAFTAAREALTALIDRIRAGENVTATELATAQSAANAETELAALHAEGVAARESEKLTRRKAAERATAASAAREELPAARKELRAHYDALIAIIGELDAADKQYRETVRRHVQALTDAGFIGITSFRRQWEIEDLPGFDPAIIPNTDSYPALELDRVHYSSHDRMGLGVVWAACRAGHYSAIDQWRRSGNSNPIAPPLPEMDEHQ